MSKTIRIALVLSISLVHASASFAFDKPALWTASTSPVFPVVRIVGCPNHFATNFPGFDWSRVAYQARTAANTWFTEGGADLRLRYVGDAAASDPRCATGSGTPGSGEILLTAELNHGGGACNVATTFTFFNGAQITNAKVILHRGTVCGGSFSPHNWDPGVDYPGPGEIDFQSVLLHELGHAIGFNHSSDPSSIMWPSTSTGNSVVRNLAADDLLGLQQAGSSYGPIQTVTRHRFTSAGQPSINWFNEGETITDSVLGSPAVSHSPLFAPNHFYLVAYTRASDHVLMFGRTNGSANAPGGFASVAAGVTSNRAPAVAASDAVGQEVIAYTDPASDALLTRVDTIGSPWGGAVSVGNSSRVPPALAFLPGRGAYVLAWADFPSGVIRTAVSTNGGQSWKNTQAWSFRTFQSFGITCRQTDECVVAFANGESHVGRLGYFHLGYNSSTESLSLGAFSSPDIGADTFGATITTNSFSGRTQLGWRDRGLATVMTSGGWGTAPGVLDHTSWLPMTTYAPPRIAFNAAWNEFTLWSVDAPRYGAL